MRDANSSIVVQQSDKRVTISAIFIGFAHNLSTFSLRKHTSLVPLADTTHDNLRPIGETNHNNILQVTTNKRKYIP